MYLSKETVKVGSGQKHATMTRLFSPLFAMALPLLPSPRVTLPTAFDALRTPQARKISSRPTTGYSMESSNDGASDVLRVVVVEESELAKALLIRRRAEGSETDACELAALETAFNPAITSTMSRREDVGEGTCGREEGKKNENQLIFEGDREIGKRVE